MKEVELRGKLKGMKVIVDDDVYERIEREGLKLYVLKRTEYAWFITCRNGEGLKSFSLRCLVLGKRQCHVTHVNGNLLDFRRENLKKQVKRLKKVTEREELRMLARRRAAERRKRERVAMVECSTEGCSRKFRPASRFNKMCSFCNAVMSRERESFMRYRVLS